MVRFKSKQSVAVNVQFSQRGSHSSWLQNMPASQGQLGSQGGGGGSGGSSNGGGVGHAHGHMVLLPDELVALGSHKHQHVAFPVE